ncbi:MAG: hypothetical protein KAX20_06065, partial [Candidatus Omnitrophica bacterium]|nr:hypothetical protein [Candidatus Omnitrophota bacterium]
MKRRYFIKIIGLSVLAAFLLQLSLSAEQTRLYKWGETTEEYRPCPVLFLHGFAKGSPDSWEDAIKHFIEKEYFKDYYKDPNHLKGYLYPVGENAVYYLERISFLDPNGSVDTYPQGKTNPQGNNKGWADTLNSTIGDLLSSGKYGQDPNIDKLLLVAHSMGGLAGREYIRVKGENKTESLIMTGTPNTGTKLASLVENMAKERKSTPWWTRLAAIYAAAGAGREIVKELLEHFVVIEPLGEAIADMKPESTFLDTLNSITYPSDATPPEEGVKYLTICGRAPGASVSPAAWRQDGSDWVVGCNSQKGIMVGGRAFVPQEEVEIEAAHTQECTQIATTGNLIKFLDYTTPVLEIDAVNGETPSEDPDAPTEITGTSITVEGTLADEYLPADTRIEWAVYEEPYGYIPIDQGELKNCFFPLSPVEDGKVAW